MLPVVVCSSHIFSEFEGSFGVMLITMAAIIITIIAMMPPILRTFFTFLLFLLTRLLRLFSEVFFIYYYSIGFDAETL